MRSQRQKRSLNSTKNAVFRSRRSKPEGSDSDATSLCSNAEKAENQAKFYPLRWDICYFLLLIRNSSEILLLLTTGWTTQRLVSYCTAVGYRSVPPVPHRSAPFHTVPYRSIPFRTVPQRSKPECVTGSICSYRDQVFKYRSDFSGVSCNTDYTRKFRRYQIFAQMQRPYQPTAVHSIEALHASQFIP